MDKDLWVSSHNLGLNCIQLRKSQRLTQEQLAKMAGVPRSTLTYIESGHGNPSLHNILKVAMALQIRPEELLRPTRSEIRHFRKKDIQQKSLQENAVIIHKLLPDEIPGMEIDFMELEPTARMKGTPHVENSREYLYCIQGQVTVHLAKTEFTVDKGELLAFPGHQPHGYTNDHNTKCRFFSVVSLAY